MNEKKLEERKKMIYGLLCDELYVPMRTKEIAMLLDIPKSKRQDLQEVLDALVEEGKAQVSKKGKYQKAEKVVKEGAFISHAKGFGFVCVEDEGEDYYIPEEYVGNAFHGDQVRIELLPPSKGKRREAKIIEVLSHDISTVVGTYEKSKNYGFVISDNARITQDIFIPQGKDMHAVDGHKVVCQITSYGKKNRNPEGVITEILGHRNDPGVDIMSIVKGFGLPDSFSDEVMAQVAKIPLVVEPSEIGGRVDLRNQDTVTIDGEDAKDLDDAITLNKTAEGEYELGVHIADVSHYVTEHSPLDKEALNRGTSVYLVDRVIPMLPFALSNGICSLNAGVDRLALSCMMTIDKKGQVKSHRIAETVIRVNERMSYTDVNDIVTNHKKETCERYEKLVPMFESMKELALILRKKRKKKGSIDFDFPECKIKLDDKGHPVAIEPYDRNIATKIIEEFMLAANQVVAEEYFWMDIPFLYRTHEYPDAEKIQDLARMTAGFGHHIKLSQGEIHPWEIQKLIEEIEGTKEEAILSRLTLRAMKRAQYTTVNTGHFGLATQYYCHFTSPIRRYPDLQIHRIIKENLRYGHSPKRIAHYESILPGVAKRCSDRERLADEAEREVDKMKKVEYMQAHIGEMYEGIISGVTSWGIYVELDNTVEGMIRLADMDDDQYEYQEEKYRVIGHYSGKEYSMGQTVKIRVIGADRLTRTIDFAIADNSPKDSE